MELTPALYMIPVSISDAPTAAVLPPDNARICAAIRHFIVENVRTARRFLKRCDPSIDISRLTFYELNGHTDLNKVASYLEPLRRGEAVGVMSEAGCPGVADPGALPAAIAQREGLRVVPLSGPSSILMSLMASGMNGQGFTFHGYLPVEDDARLRAIRALEQESRRLDRTQIFIETPYRNARMLRALAETLHPDTRLCVAAAITDPARERIVTLPAREWKRREASGEQFFDIKEPAIFLVYSR